MAQDLIIDNPWVFSESLKQMRNIANSSEYKEASRAFSLAESAFDDAQHALAVGQAEFDRQIQDAIGAADETIDQARRTLDDTIASARQAVEDTSKAVDNFLEEQSSELTDLQLSLQSVALQALRSRVSDTRSLVETLKNDKTAMITVNRGLDILGKLGNDQLDELDRKLKAFTGSLVTDVRLELVGTIKAKADKVDPFTITVTGKLGGTQDFRFELEWRPWEQGLDDSSWFKRLGKALLGRLRGDEGAVVRARGVRKL